MLARLKSKRRMWGKRKRVMLIDKRVEGSFIVPRSQFEVRKGEVPERVSSPSSSDHLEYTKKLEFKDQHFLAQGTFPHILYKPLFVIDEL